MTRTLTAGMQTAVAAATGETAFLVSLEFYTGAEVQTTRITTANADITWSSQTWTAVGGALTFQSVVESRSVTESGIELTLDGVKLTGTGTIMAPLLANHFIGRTGEVYLVHFGSDGSITADPLKLFSGLLNAPFVVSETAAAGSPEDADRTATIRTRLTSPLGAFKQTRGIRATVTSHQHHYASDTFWGHLTAVPKNVLWGKATPRVGGGGTGGEDSEGEEERWYPGGVQDW